MRIISLHNEMCVCIGLHCTYPVRFFSHPPWLQWCQLTALYISRRSYRKIACHYINLWHINGAMVSFPECWALLFWFCCMTLLGWVPEENLAESGSNVKSAAESRTEWEKPQKSAWCSLKKKKKKVRQLQRFFSFNGETHHGECFDIQKQICKCVPAHNTSC